MQQKIPPIKRVSIDPNNPDKGFEALFDFVASSFVKAENDGVRISGHEFNAQVKKIKKEMFGQIDATKTDSPTNDERDAEHNLNLKYADWLSKHGFKDIRHAFKSFIAVEVKDLETKSSKAFQSFLSKGLSLSVLKKIAASDYQLFLNTLKTLETDLPKVDLFFTNLLHDISGWLKEINLIDARISSLLAYQKMFKVISAWVGLLQHQYSSIEFPPMFSSEDIRPLVDNIVIIEDEKEIKAIHSKDPEIVKFLTQFAFSKVLLDELIDACGRIGIFQKFPAFGYINFFSVETLLLGIKTFQDLSKGQIPSGLIIINSKNEDTQLLDSYYINEQSEKLNSWVQLVLRSEAFGFALMRERSKLMQDIISKFESKINSFDKNTMDSLFVINNNVSHMVRKTNSVIAVDEILYSIYVTYIEFLVLLKHENLLKQKILLHAEFAPVALKLCEILQNCLDINLTYHVLKNEKIAKIVEISYSALLNALSIYGLLIDPKSSNYSESKTFLYVCEKILETCEFLRKFSIKLNYFHPIKTLNAVTLLPSTKHYKRAIGLANSHTVFIPDSNGNLYLTPKIYEFFSSFKTELSQLKASFHEHQAKEEQKKVERDINYKKRLEEYQSKQNEIENFAEQDFLEKQQEQLAQQEAKLQQKERKLQKSFLPRFKKYDLGSTSSNQVPELSDIERHFKEAMSLRLEGKYCEAGKILSYIAFETSTFENREVVLYALVYLALDYVNQTSAIANTCERALRIRPNKLDAIFAMTRKADDVRILQNNLTIAIEKASEITLQVGNDSEVKLNEALRINEHVMQMMGEIKERMTAVQNKFNEICEKIKENKKFFKQKFPEIYYSGNPDNPSPYSQMMQAIQEASHEVVETSIEINVIRTKHKESIFSKHSFLQERTPTFIQDDFEIGLSPKNISIMNKTSRLNPRHAEFFNEIRNEQQRNSFSR